LSLTPSFLIHTLLSLYSSLFFYVISLLPLPFFLFSSLIAVLAQY